MQPRWEVFIIVGVLVGSITGCVVLGVKFNLILLEIGEIPDVHLLNYRGVFFAVYNFFLEMK